MNGQPDYVETVRLDPPGCIAEGWNLAKDQYGLFLGVTVVGSLLAGIVPFGIIMGPMYCGIFLAYLMAMKGQPIEFATLFKGFDYFIESLVVTILLVIATAAVLAPLAIVMVIIIAVGAGLGESTDSGPLAALVIVPSVVMLVVVMAVFSAIVYGIWFFSYPLLVERNMDAFGAMKLSARTVWANKWGILGLMLINWLLASILALFCYIPALLYLPVMFGSFAVAYRRMFPELAPPPPPEM